MEGFALATVIAAVVAFILGTVFDFNIGLLCIVTGFLASVACGGTGNEIIAAISPITIVRFVGMLFLFTIANKNGTMEKICSILLKLLKGKRFLAPLVFGVVGGAANGLGASGIAASALMSGPSASMAKRAKINPMLMTTVTLHGVFAGHYSSISTMGISVGVYLASVEILGVEGKLLGWNIVLQIVAMLAAFCVFGGIKLMRESKDGFTVEITEADTKLDNANILTLAAIALLIINMFTLKYEMGIVATILGMLVLFFSKKYKMLTEGSVIKDVPWGTIIMITGAMALMTVMSDAGGTELIVNAIHSLNIGTFSLLLLMAAAGLMSFYATSTPIVLAIIPLAIGLCQTMGIEYLIPGVIIGICVVAIVVDVSPLSNNGALFLAAFTPLLENEGDSRKLFNQLFAYGMSMIVVWSLICWLLFVIIGI